MDQRSCVQAGVLLVCTLCWAPVVPDYLVCFTGATILAEVLLVCILRYGRRSSLERWYDDANFYLEGAIKMATEIVQTTFGYEALDEAKRVRIQVKAESIRARMKRTADDIIAIGLDLIDVKEDLGHGQFEHWISAEFDMNLRSAQRFMQAAERFDS